MHGLRHTHATLLLEVGTHAKVIQERLDHADAKTTMDTYAHVTHTLQENTVNQFTALLDNKKNRSTERLVKFWRKKLKSGN
ncbi:tyrosine-type recombinase/integrase [uncultured Exiguobacterium sp.]|uniref:tyrosine-type recombinase/integrase n=1 Tax=uncultured Exiguobacterium sp. TaxID=202669 RepID=UPI003747ACFD